MSQLRIHLVAKNVRDGLRSRLSRYRELIAWQTLLSESPTERTDSTTARPVPVAAPAGHRSSRGGMLRVATLNVFGLRENWPSRRDIVRAGLSRLRPDLVSLQEVVARADYDQARDVLGSDYHIAHHPARLADGQGDSIASLWPVIAVHEVDVPADEGAGDVLGSALAVEVDVPSPVGRVVFVNHPADFQLPHESQRERQAVVVAGYLEQLVAEARAHVIVAGDLNATPDAASIRFWTGKQSLGGLSVCYRDAWAAIHAEPGATFTPDNALTTSAEGGKWELELGRRIDYILVRCVENGPTLHIRSCDRFLDEPEDGVWGSDHFGVTAELTAFTPRGHSAPQPR